MLIDRKRRTIAVFMLQQKGLGCPVNRRSRARFRSAAFAPKQNFANVAVYQFGSGLTGLVEMARRPVETAPSVT